MASEDDEAGRFSVPKFSSFKSKGDLKANERPHEIRKKHDRDGRSSSHKSSEHHRSRHSRYEAHHHKERRRSRSRENRQHHVEAGNSRLHQNGVPGLFLIDLKGDPLIRKYGGIDRSQIPAYYRHGAGRVLGTVGRLMMHHDGPRDQFSLRMPGEGTSRFGDKTGLRSRTSRIKSRPIRARAGGPEEGSDEIEGYLPLSSSKKRKRSQADEDSTDNEQPSYRSIEGKAKPKDDSHSDENDDSDTSMEITVTSQSNPLKWKSIQLNKRVKDTPEDIDSWLELVDHQDALLKAGEDLDHIILESEAHSFSEIKVSMLESALKHVKNIEDRRRVLVQLMREGVKVWSSKTSAKKWVDALRDDGDDFSIWKAHIDFLVSNITTFQYDDIKMTILGRLRHVLSHNVSNQSTSLFEEAIHVFLIATRFVHDAGYKELAVAAWQGLLELNLFRPRNLEASQQALESFHDFWESEVPRIGDADAKGWRSFVEAGEIGDPLEPATEDRIEPPTSRDPYKIWGFLEKSHSNSSAMPARTMDDGTEDDPFRVVMFSDIEPFLFVIPEGVLPHVLEQLIDDFLLFSDFPPAFRKSDWIEAALEDQWLASSFASVDLRVSEREEKQETEIFQAKAPYFKRASLFAALSPSLLFSGEGWFHPFNPEVLSQPAKSSWVRETVRQMVHSAGIEGVAQYYLALCFSQDSSSIKKPAKALLKRFPADSMLYNAYALAEFVKDPSVASKVLASSTESSSLSSGWRGFMFYRTWSWFELEQGHLNLSVKRLCSSVDVALRVSQIDNGSKVSNMTLLKTQQTFMSNFQDFLSAEDLMGAGILAECLVLLSYLTAEGNSEPTSTTQGNISAAMNTVRLISDEFQSRKHATDSAYERFLQFAAQILYFNASRGPFRRIYMREQLSRFIAHFPRNSIFLSLFEWSDVGIRVIDETRDLLYKQVLVKPHDCISSRAFAIQHEISHGNINTTRTAFENAVSSDASRYNPALWISYIRFCHSQKQLKVKPKEVFYRALRQCPGSKEVIMEAFVTLIRDMESDELRAVYNTMTSKGLRVHVDLEEHLDKEAQRRSIGRKQK